MLDGCNVFNQCFCTLVFNLELLQFINDGLIPSVTVKIILSLLFHMEEQCFVAIHPLFVVVISCSLGHDRDLFLLILLCRCSQRAMFPLVFCKVLSFPFSNSRRYRKASSLIVTGDPFFPINVVMTVFA